LKLRAVANWGKSKCQERGPKRDGGKMGVEGGKKAFGEGSGRFVLKGVGLGGKGGQNNLAKRRTGGINRSPLARKFSGGAYQRPWDPRLRIDTLQRDGRGEA